MHAVSTSRIEARFRELEERRAKGLVVYLTAGDPTLEATGGLVAAVDRGGADVIELGVPFSDPLADGPVIQRASERALRAGATLRKILERLPGWREAARAPVILFTYYNPVLQYGLENFARAAAEAGADGALVVDLTPEEAEAYVSAMRARKLDTAFLASPTSTDERLERVAKLSSGFLYLISRTGVTGERSEIASTLRPLVERSRRFTSLPLAVGFGLSTPAQVREVQILADAAVVGSALVRAIEDHCRVDGGRMAQGFGHVEQFVRWLKHGTGTEPQ
ncbi:MAG: tryptophan synthase subunit alpha [Acidobacteria bacterium]|nr:MAG: tryptophan synthase subunit alpha [Acidobacteriota bacterium]